MSWFSDLAKSALNEAQKRIDKVLDIDEGGLPKPSNTTITTSALNTGGSLRSPSVNDNVSSPPKYKSNPSPKPVLNTSISKKRGKPMKLGSSLSKKQIENKSTVLSKPADVIKNKVELSNESNDQFADIPLQNECILDIPSKVIDSNDEHVSFDSPIQDDNPKDSTVPLGYPERNNANHTPPCAMQNEHSVENGICSTSPKHASEVTQSPCGSTTASSEIDILDHESTMSETSTVSKLVELDNHLHLLPCENNFGIRSSPDNIDSEASDIVHLSGYCTSPLSVDGFDNRAFIPVLAKSSVPFSEQDHCDMETKDKDPTNVENTEALSFMPNDSLMLFEKEDKSSCLDSSSEIHVDNKEAHFRTISEAIPNEEVVVQVHLRQNNSENTLTSNDLFLDEDKHNNIMESCNMPIELVADNISRPEIDLERIPQNSNLEDIEGVADKAIVSDFKSDESHVSIPKSNTTVEAEVLEHTPPENVLESETVINSPTQEAEVSKNAEPVQQDDVMILEKDVKGMKERFEVYEQQLMTLSTNNAKLSEDNDNLRNELCNATLTEQKRFQEEQDNLMQTIASLSEKIQTLEVERSDQAEKVVLLQSDLSTRLSNEQVQSLLTEKEESIQGLLQEGEALSKQHLQQSNTIKKLRQKVSEREQNNKDLSVNLAKFEDENKILKAKLAEIEGQSSQNRGTAERLSEAYQEREMELSDIRSKLEDADEKRRAAQSTLDVAYKDLADLNKKLAAQQSERDLELEQNEANVLKKMQQEIEKLQREHEHQIHMRMLEIGELQDSIERTEVISLRKEDQLRKEIKDLQQRLQDSDLRNHELSDSISESTRPLLRQIENLQLTYSNQTKSWEALEKSLTSRLGDAQMQLVASQDKERALQMALVECKSRLGSQEKQLTELHAEKTTVKTELDKVKSGASQYGEKIANLTNELEQCQQDCEEIKAKARRDRLTLENQLDMEKVRAEADRKKLQSQLEIAQKEKERLLWMSRSDSMTSAASLINNDAESVSSSTDTFNNFDPFDRPISASGPPSAVYESIRSGISGSSLLENLQSQLKQRDGEITQLQGEINTLERTRSSMAEEIVRLTNDNEDLENTAKEVNDLKKSLKEMESRHEAVLTMYGEKAEEAEELKMDLEDVKSMYRQQIDALLQSDPGK
ncbi:unnamed protein product [Clavelina lepadiformis]|uniref:TATA element modulatory factor 1 TATA binding domain-containing protein n=1 Tax=Clavelina lepadiformis TaxID=159417 RepID=A0ABP0FV08_CLALP